MLSQHSLLKAKDGKINIIFDIDGVLTFHSTRLSPNIVAIFEKYGCVISAAEHTHYVSPGVKELMKLLFSLPYVRVSFFSSGAKVRNVEFVEKLLILSLGLDTYRSIKDEVIVLSREDRVYYGHRDVSTKLAKICQRLNGEYKKDISKVLRPEDSIDEAILIEDDPSFICLGQHKNLLVSPESDEHSYNILEEGHCHLTDKYYDSSFKGVNNIFYVTGLLMKLLAEHRSGSKRLTDGLFDINYITHEAYRKDLLLRYERGELLGNPMPDYNPPDLESCWHKPMSELPYYESGLKILREHNPDLTLIDSELYKKIVAVEKKQLSI